MRQNRRFVCFILVRNPVTFVAGFFFFPTTRNNFSGVVVMTKSKAKTINSDNTAKTTKLAVTAMLAALSAVLMFFEFPLGFIAPSFYEFDFSEVPVLVGTFSMGPIAGAVIEFVKILVKFLIKGTSTGGVGELANFLIGCSFILPAGFIYKYKKQESVLLSECLRVRLQWRQSVWFSTHSCLFRSTRHLCRLQKLSKWDRQFSLQLTAHLHSACTA